MFSCEFYEISKNALFTEHLRWLLLPLPVKFRSRRTEVSLGKGVLKICSKFTGEHPCRSAISIKLLYNFIGVALRHACSPVNLLHIFRTPFPWNTYGWLLQHINFKIRYLIPSNSFTFFWGREKGLKSWKVQAKSVYIWTYVCIICLHITCYMNTLILHHTLQWVLG